MDGHLVYSHSSVVVNDAAVNVHWSYLFQIRILFPLDIYPEVGLLDDMVVLFLIFEESNTVFHNGHTILCFHQSAQFSSVTQSCPTLCNPMNRSTPGLPVHHQLPEFTQTRPLSQWCHPTIPSSVVPVSFLQSFPASASLLMKQFFTTGGQSIGASASTSVLPMIFRIDFL